MKKYRMSIVSLVLFGVVFIIAYIWHLFTKEDVPFQMLAALLGAAITVVITNLLLNSQTESEFDKQKMSKVYEEKLQIYHQYINLLCDVVQDNKISIEELSKLKSQLSLVALHTSKESFNTVLMESAWLIKDECSEPDANRIRNMSFSYLIKIVDCFHDELYGNSVNKIRKKKRSIPPVEYSCVDFLDTIMHTSVIYNKKGRGRVTREPAVQEIKFARKTKEWKEKYGWIKDEGNEIEDPENNDRTIKKDFLRFYKGDVNSPDKYVEIRYEIVYDHYILRGECGDLDKVKILHNLYGGYMQGSMWWKVLNVSPFASMKIREFCNTFDDNTQLQELVALMFEDIIGILDYSQNDN